MNDQTTNNQPAQAGPNQEHHTETTTTDDLRRAWETAWDAGKSEWRRIAEHHAAAADAHECIKDLNRTQAHACAGRANPDWKLCGEEATGVTIRREVLAVAHQHLASMAQSIYDNMPPKNNEEWRQLAEACRCYHNSHTDVLAEELCLAAYQHRYLAERLRANAANAAAQPETEAEG